MCKVRTSGTYIVGASTTTYVEDGRFSPRCVALGGGRFIAPARVRRLDLPMPLSNPPSQHSLDDAATQENVRSVPSWSLGIFF